MSNAPATGRSSKTPPPSDNGVAHKDVIKREFGQRLYRLLVEKGMSQTELARKAAKYTPDKKFGRDLISSYISGRYVPNPISLEAMARALDIKAEDLLPQASALPRRGEATPPFDIRVLGDNRASLRVNQIVTLGVALKVAQLINDDTKKD